MMNLDQVLENFKAQDGELSQRVNQAMQYQVLFVRNEINRGEYDNLLRDLNRLDNIQLTSAELDQQLAFHAAIELLRNIQLP